MELGKKLVLLESIKKLACEGCSVICQISRELDVDPDFAMLLYIDNLLCVESEILEEEQRQLNEENNN